MSHNTQPGDLRPVFSLPGRKQIVDGRKQAFLGRVPGFLKIMVEAHFVNGAHGCFDIGISRKQDSSCGRVEFAAFCQYIHTEHRRHALIADDHGQSISTGFQLADGDERSLSGGGGENAVIPLIVRLQIPPEGRQYLSVVVNGEDDGAVLRQRA